MKGGLLDVLPPLDSLHQSLRVLRIARNPLNKVPHSVCCVMYLCTVSIIICPKNIYVQLAKSRDPPLCTG